MTSPIQELKGSRSELITRFSGGEAALGFQESYTEIIDQYFRRNLEEGEAGRVLFKEKKPFCFVAVGGYGRKDLSIHSDIDVIILFGSRIPAHAKTLVESVFYPLWDTGLDLGHGIRNIKDCVNLARQDFGVLASLLDARFVCGEPDLFFSLMESVQKKAISRKAAQFGKWLQEQDRLRMAAFGDASFLLEPNLKEGIGGLRDYHQILWLSRVFFDLGVPRDLEYTGILSHREYSGLREDLDFIGLVRNHLHLMSGRKNDRLTFDFQEKIAGALAFQSKEDLLPVEQFLSRLHATMASVKSLHRSFVLTHVPGRFHTKRNTEQERLSEFIVSQNGEIGFGSATAIVRNPHLLMEVYRWSASLNSPLSLETKRLIKEFLHLIDEDFRRSEKVNHDFHFILREPYAFEALEQMDEVGVLGSFIPEFEQVRGRVQFDSYHIYPVGTHLLQTVKYLKGLGKEKNILLLDILSDLPHPERLLLASLLHDIGKIGRSHSRKGAVIAHKILKRMAYEDQASEDVTFLISNHLLLAETATRRDLNDEKIVVQCARTIGTIERLKMLYLLTWADSKATGPRAWNDWTENLVMELFFKILHTLERGELATPDASRKVKGNLQQVRRIMTGQMDAKALDAVFEAMSPRYILNTEPKDVVRHIRLYKEIRESLGLHPSTTFALETQKSVSEPAWEVLFIARDRPGLFSDIAGVLALNNINILSAHIYTWKDGTAVDIFKVSSPMDPIHTDQLWNKARRDLAGAFEGKLSLSQRLEEKSPPVQLHRPIKGIHPPEVSIDNGSSDFFTLVEVFADDRVGLLYLITHTLFQLKLDIRISKIATRGDQIADIFYVLDLDGQKVQGQAEVEEIRKTLTRVLRK